MLDSSDIRCLVLSFRWWFVELFFVCADLLRWVPIFLHTVYSAQFCLHRCRSSLMLSYVFKMLSVDWYVRNRIKHVHPVSDGNSRCRLGAARHSTTSRVLPAQSASRVTVRHGMNVPDSLWVLDLQGQIWLRESNFLVSPLLEIHNHLITTREPWIPRLLHRPDCFMVSILCAYLYT